MEQSKIDRINELYRKSKAEGLTRGGKKGTGASAQTICGGCEEESHGTVE